jgi:hypothetical protein
MKQPPNSGAASSILRIERARSRFLAEHKPKRRDYQLHAELDTLGLPESGLTTHREPNTRAPSLSHREVCLSGAKRQKSIPSIRRSDR